MAARGEEFKDDFRKALPRELVAELSRVSPARAAWSVLAEPGDTVAGALIEALGAVEALIDFVTEAGPQ